MRLFVLISLVCGALVLPFAGSASAQFTVETDSYEIALPRGWKTIPRQILVKESDRAAQGEGTRAKHPSYDSGFQLESAGWMHYPLILVKRLDSGRIPEYHFTLMPRADLSRVAPPRNGGIDLLLLDVGAGVMHYDESDGLVWGVLKASAEGADALRLSIVVPTEKGTIEIDCYALRDEFLNYISLFKKVAGSVKVAPKLFYKRHASRLGSVIENTDWTEAAVEAVLGGIIGAALALFFVLRRKKSDD